MDSAKLWTFRAHSVGQGMVETVPGIGPPQKGTFGQHCKSQTRLSNFLANHKNQSHRSIQASSKQYSTASTLVGLMRLLFSR